MADGRIGTSRTEQTLGPARSSQAVFGEAIPQLSHDVGPWLYVVALLCLVGLVAFLYLAQTTSVAKQTEEMESLEGELHRLKWDNDALLLQIAQHQRASRIKQEAKAMGLGEADQVEYIEVALDRPDVSLGGDMAERSPSSLPMASPRFPAWLDRLVAQFGDWASGGPVPADQSDRW